MVFQIREKLARQWPEVEKTVIMGSYWAPNGPMEYGLIKSIVSSHQLTISFDGYDCQQGDSAFDPRTIIVGLPRSDPIPMDLLDLKIKKHICLT